MNKGLLFVGLFAVLSACSSGNGSCQTTTSGTTYCTEYTGSGVNADAVRSACTATMGTYGSSVCASANRVGRCTYTVGTLTSVSAFYSPTPATTGQQICMALSGTWAAN